MYIQCTDLPHPMEEMRTHNTDLPRPMHIQCTSNIQTYPIQWKRCAHTIQTYLVQCTSNAHPMYRLTSSNGGDAHTQYRLTSSKVGDAHTQYRLTSSTKGIFTMPSHAARFPSRSTCKFWSISERWVNNSHPCSANDRARSSFVSCLPIYLHMRMPVHACWSCAADFVFLWV